MARKKCLNSCIGGRKISITSWTVKLFTKEKGKKGFLILSPPGNASKVWAMISLQRKEKKGGRWDTSVLGNSQKQTEREKKGGWVRVTKTGDYTFSDLRGKERRMSYSNQAMHEGGKKILNFQIWKYFNHPAYSGWTHLNQFSISPHHCKDDFLASDQTRRTLPSSSTFSMHETMHAMPSQSIHATQVIIRASLVHFPQGSPGKMFENMFYYVDNNYLCNLLTSVVGFGEPPRSENSNPFTVFLFAFCHDDRRENGSRSWLHAWGGISDEIRLKRFCRSGKRQKASLNIFLKRENNSCFKVE